MPDSILTRIQLEPSAAAPYLARRLVGALVDRGPRIKAVDAALLVSELVTLAATGSSPIEMSVSSGSRRIRVEVDLKGALGPDELVRALLDRLADRWDSGPPSWFELDLVRRAAPENLTDEELWGRLPHDPAAREAIFTRHEGLARAIARRFRRGGEQADLDQVAYMALVAAIDRFDIERGVRFSTFAGKTISGELKKHLRDTAWAIKVPRSLKEAVLAVTRERNRLSQLHGREPTPEELAAATGLSEADVMEAMEAGQAFGAVSLDAPTDGESTAVGDTLGDDDPGLVDAEAWWAIEPILQNLSERDQQVLHLRFFEDMSQSEIADIIGVSQMQVSRILSGIFEKVKTDVEAM